MTLIGALLCRNEAAPDRYLKLVLDNALSFCDHIVAYDDGSTDATPDVLRENGVEIVAPEGSPGPQPAFWGRDEVTPRACLWDAASKAAGPDGWIYVFDADHELVGVTSRDLRTACRSDLVNAWTMPLWDCWDSSDTMRVDGFWQAHLHPRPWLFRAQPTPGFTPDWSCIDRKGVHTGHCPPNYPARVGVLPGAAIRHWSYVKPEHRARKIEQYLKLAPA